MQDQLTSYAAFYKVRHKGHKLEWDHALGTATLKARFNAGKKELSVSLYQSIILLLFNEATELSYADISDLTRMGESSSSFVERCMCRTESCDNRGQRASQNITKFGLQQQESIEEATSWQECRRRRRILLQYRFHGSSSEGAYQFYSVQRDGTFSLYYPVVNLSSSWVLCSLKNPIVLKHPSRATESITWMRLLCAL